MKPLFHPHDPKITPADRERITPHIGNTKYCLKWLKDNPTKEDIQRGILLEMENGKPSLGRGVLYILLRRYRMMETWELEARILNRLNPKK